MWRARKQLRWLKAAVKDPTIAFRDDHATDWSKLADVVNEVAIFGDDLDRQLATILQNVDSPLDGGATQMSIVDELERRSVPSVGKVGGWFEVAPRSWHRDLSTVRL